MRELAVMPSRVGSGLARKGDTRWRHPTICVRKPEQTCEETRVFTKTVGEQLIHGLAGRSRADHLSI